MSDSSAGHHIVERLRKECDNFGPKYPKKFGGAVAVEILREELKHAGILTSARDVYIRGVHAEIDLLIPRASTKPVMDLLYEPQNVAVALEVKKTGSYGEGGLAKIKSDFALLKAAGVKCAYISFEDCKTYKWLPKHDPDKFPFEVFVLAWHIKWGGELVAAQENENWEAFLKFLREARELR